MDQNEKPFLFLYKADKKLYEGETAYKETTKSQLSYMKEVLKNMSVYTKSKLASSVLFCDEFIKGENSPFKRVELHKKNKVF